MVYLFLYLPEIVYNNYSKLYVLALYYVRGGWNHTIHREVANDCS